MPSPLARPKGSAQAAPAPEEVPDIGALYRRHAQDVGRWAARLAGHGVDCEDVVHQVFLVAQRRLPEFRGEAKITTWLHGITVRVVQEARRRQRRWWLWPVGPRGSGPAAELGGDDFAALPADQPTALELLERKEAGRIVYQILNELDEKYRTALILFELEGLSGQEVAELTKTSLSNVWVRLLRGRKQFTKRFLTWEAECRRASEKASRRCRS